MPINKALIAAMKLIVSKNNALRVRSLIVNRIPPKPAPIAITSANVLLNIVTTKNRRGIVKSFWAILFFDSSVKDM